MRIVIYGETYTRANAKLVEIVDDLRYGDVLDFRLNKDQSICKLKNGDSIMAVSKNGNSLDYRWNYAYIDVYIDKEIINNCIKPCFTDRNITTDGSISYSTLKESYEYYD